jgi:hypothetical protein
LTARAWGTHMLGIVVRVAVCARVQGLP